jgi:hypothetical protein
MHGVINFFISIGNFPNISRSAENLPGEKSEKDFLILKAACIQYSPVIACTGLGQ